MSQETKTAFDYESVSYNLDGLSVLIEGLGLHVAQGRSDTQEGAFYMLADIARQASTEAKELFEIGIELDKGGTS